MTILDLSPQYSAPRKSRIGVHPSHRLAPGRLQLEQNSCRHSWHSDSVSALLAQSAHVKVLHKLQTMPCSYRHPRADVKSLRHDMHTSPPIGFSWSSPHVEQRYVSSVVGNIDSSERWRTESRGDSGTMCKGQVVSFGFEWQGCRTLPQSRHLLPRDVSTFYPIFTVALKRRGFRSMNEGRG